jgi:hypothetical protein
MIENNLLLIDYEKKLHSHLKKNYKELFVKLKK